MIRLMFTPFRFDTKLIWVTRTKELLLQNQFAAVTAMQQQPVTNGRNFSS